MKIFLCEDGYYSERLSLFCNTLLGHVGYIIDYILWRLIYFVVICLGAKCIAHMHKNVCVLMLVCVPSDMYVIGLCVYQILTNWYKKTNVDIL
jgi:hypothetical protein